MPSDEGDAVVHPVETNRVPVVDLPGEQPAGELVLHGGLHQAAQRAGPVDRVETDLDYEIGRASCRERV